MDLSLRSNPDSYIDRENESEIIKSRIDNDASTVIGISGLRGAGKSSLAKKMLKECEDSGYFTLLIHSPTGYDSREFLITIYSRICETTIHKLESIFGIKNTLESKADQLKKEIKSYINIVIGGLAILLFVLCILIYYSYNKRIEENELKYIKGKTSIIGNELELLDTQKKNLSNSLNDTISYSTRDSLNKTMKLIDLKLEELNYQKSYLTERKAYNEFDFIKNSFATFVLGLLIYVLVIFVYIFLLKPRFRLRKNIIMFPKEYGLYKIAQENLEYLKFQSTITNTSEIGANAGEVLN